MTTPDPHRDPQGPSASSVVALVTSKASKPPKKRATDWEAVEIAYRTGRFSLRQLTTKFGPSAAAICRKAEAKGWTKDLTEAIRHATAAKLVSASLPLRTLAGAVETVATANATDTQRRGQNATDTVLRVAELNAEVILAHRGRVSKATDVVMRMLTELDATTRHAGEIQALFEALTDASQMNAQQLATAQQQLRDLLRLHSRIGSVQKLMEALGKAQVLERQAFGLDDQAGKPPPAQVDWDSIPESERLAAYLRMVSDG